MPAHISITGRLARDPDTRTTTGGTTVTKLTVPVDTGWGDNKTTTWWTCTLFGKRAESAARYLEKGKWVSLQGAAEVRTYDKKDGSKGFSAEVQVADWSFVGSREDNAGGQPSAQDVERSEPRYKKGYSDSDLPF
jgi:single-strand DNA-binding protein